MMKSDFLLSRVLVCVGVLGLGFVGEVEGGDLNVSLGVHVVDSEEIYNTVWMGSLANTAGTIVVDGVGAKLTNNNTFYVGYEGEGALDILNGGVVSYSFMKVGVKTGSKGVINIDGVGSKLKANWPNLEVGLGGVGELNITNGGSANGIIGSVGTGSTINVRGANSELGLGSFILGGGLLQIDDGGNVGTFELFMSEVGIFEFGLSDVYTVGELFALSVPWIDNEYYSFAGEARLGGQLEVIIPDGFQLEEGQVFGLIDVGAVVIGTFEDLPEGALVTNFGGQELDLFISYVGGDGNDVVLYTVPEPSGVLLIGGMLGMGIVKRRK